MNDSLALLDFPLIREKLAAVCSSQIAKELANQLQPMYQKEAIQEALDETVEAMNSLDQEMEQPLGGTRDIRKAVSKTRKDIVLSHDELWDIYTTITAYDRMYKFFHEKYMTYPLLSLHLQDMVRQDRLERQFERTFDKKGELLDSATPKLQQLRTTISRLRSRVRTDLQEILHNPDNQKYFQEAIVTQRNNRYVIPVKQEYRSAVDGLIHDRSATGATLYIEPMRLVNLNNDLQEALLAEEQEVQAIYRQLSSEIRKQSDDLLDTCEAVSHIEFVYGKAQLALQMKAHPAHISDKRDVKLLSARHPLLPANAVVPVTITLGIKYRILLITGSNTGGKTVSMKTLGLLALMNQAGLCIPAEADSVLPIFDHIYADIGDEQSIEASLSTFSAHMTQVSEILHAVSSRDLVLLDELGSGTDPEEGASLAVAILDYFKSKGCLMMVSTHYNELKHYAYETDGVENGHVEFDERTLRPTYRLHIGVAGSSHALSIAARLGLPKEVIAQAKAYRDEQHSENMEAVLSELNEQLRKVGEKERRLRNQLADVKKAKHKVEREKQEVSAKKQAILEKAREQAETMKRSVRIESEQVIKALKAQFSEKNKEKRQQAIAKARKGISSIAIPEGTREERQGLTEKDLKVGLTVYVPSLRATGTITALQGKRVQVDVNGLTATLKLKEIARATLDEERALRHKDRKTSPVKPRKRAGVGAIRRQQAATTEINIIGKTVDEGVMLVGQFIDQALLAGINQVRIVHGKGTGALRAGIQGYLDSLPVVKRYEMAGYNEGGAGATIVYL